MRVFAALTLATLSIAAPAQVAQKEQPPTFKSGTDLLTVQAAVVDKEGKPVGDLQPADFSVSVGGKPRKVTFARFYGSAGTSVLGTTPGAVTDPRRARRRSWALAGSSCS
ncbi:hypothetical protein BH18ACI5_BH18ACI5_06890 [soil metagenome]